MRLKYMSSGELAKKENVTTQTIRRWVESGRYEHVEYTHGNRLRIGIPCERVNIYYARVSSKKQEGSLINQINNIQNKFGGDAEIIKDIGSGFNFKRKGFISLLERACRGEVLDVVVSDQDRLTRVGFDFIKWIIELGGGSVCTINKPIGEQGFDYENLISYITVFCNSYYGKRSGRNKKDKDISKRQKEMD